MDTGFEIFTQGDVRSHEDKDKECRPSVSLRLVKSGYAGKGGGKLERLGGNGIAGVGNVLEGQWSLSPTF